MSAGAVLNYTVTEHDTSGPHNAIYSVIRHNDGQLRYLKVRQDDMFPPATVTVSRRADKIIDVDPATRTITRVRLTESMGAAINREVPASFPGSRPSREVARETTYSDVDDKFDRLSLTANSDTTVLRISAAVLDLPRPDHAEVQHDSINGRLSTRSTAQKAHAFFMYRDCIQQEHDADVTGRSTNTSCYSEMVSVAKTLNAEETRTFGRQCLAANVTYAKRWGALGCVDTLAAVGTPAAQAVLTGVMQERPMRRWLVVRAMFSAHQVRDPMPALVEALTTLAYSGDTAQFGERNGTLAAHQAVLMLGFSAWRLEGAGKPAAAAAIVERLVRELELIAVALEQLPVPATLPHHIHIGRRAAVHTAHFAVKGLHLNQSIFVRALGNAGAKQALGRLLNLAETSHPDLVVRESVHHALRKYNSTRVEEVLALAALTDPHPVVRRAAHFAFGHQNRSVELATLFRAAQESLDAGPNNNSTGNATMDSLLDWRTGGRAVMASRSRRRRGLVDQIIPQSWINFLERLEFDLRLPAVDWSKEVGGRTVGGSVGLTLVNEAVLQQDKLKSTFDLEVHDEAWFEVHAFGLMVDIFRARLCFAGHISFDLNVLKWLGLEGIQPLVDGFAEIVELVKDKLIKGFRRLWDWITGVFGGDGENDPVKEITEGVGAVPAALDNVTRVFTAVGSVGAQTPYLPLMDVVKRTVRRATAIFRNAKRDVMTLYYRIYNAIRVDLPWAFKQLYRSGKLARDGFKTIMRNPVEAIQLFAEAVRGIQSSVSVGKYAIAVIKKAIFWSDGNIPMWLDAEYHEEVIDDLREVWNRVVNRHRRMRRQADADPDDSAAAQEVTIWQQTMTTLGAFFGDQTAGRAGPFRVFQQIKEWILDPFQIIHDIITLPFKLIKLAKKGYEAAKELIGTVFGPKFSGRFTFGVRECTNACECGTYPSTGKGVYPDNPGIGLRAVNSGDSAAQNNETSGGGRRRSFADALGGISVSGGGGTSTDSLQPGMDIVAPFGAVVVDISDNKIILGGSDSAFSSFEVILDNVRPTVTVGDTVGVGELIGHVADASLCTPLNQVGGVFHLSMRKKADAEASNQTMEFINPTQYLITKSSPGGRWIYECDDYSITLMENPILAGSFTGGDTDVSDRPLLFPPNGTYYPEFGGVMQNDPLGCTGPQWACETLAAGTPMQSGCPTGYSSCRRARQVAGKNSQSDPLTIYGDHFRHTVAAAACEADQTNETMCRSSALHAGFGFADAPCDHAHEHQAELCPHTTCSKLGSLCEEYLKESESYQAFLRRPGADMHTIARIAKHTGRRIPVYTSVAYRTIYGSDAVVSCHAPNSTATVAQTKGLILDQAHAWYTHAQVHSTGDGGYGDSGLFAIGKLLHMLADSQSADHVIRNPDTMDVAMFLTLECSTTGRRHSLTDGQWDTAVELGVMLFKALQRRTTAREFVAYLEARVFKLAPGVHTAQDDRGCPVAVEASLSPAKAIAPKARPRRSSLQGTRVRRGQMDTGVAAKMKSSVIDIVGAACRASDAVADDSVKLLGPTISTEVGLCAGLPSHPLSPVIPAIGGGSRASKAPLIAGAVSMLAPCRDVNRPYLVIPACQHEVIPDQQHIYGLADFPNDGVVRCEAHSHVSIGPRAGQEGLNSGLAGIHVNTSLPFEFPRVGQSFVAWEGAQKNRLVDIQGRIITQVQGWYGSAFEALTFDRAIDTAPANRTRLVAAKRGRVREFGWVEVGKIAFTIVQILSGAHTQRDADGDVTMFFARHCMDKDMLEQYLELERTTTSGPYYQKAVRVVRTLVNHYTALYLAASGGATGTSQERAERRSEWLVGSSLKELEASQFVAGLFRAEVVSIKMADAKRVAGLYPACSRPLIAVVDLTTAAKSAGVEGSKCFLKRAADSGSHPPAFYEAQRCENVAWANTLGLESVFTAISVFVFSNPMHRNGAVTYTDATWSGTTSARLLKTYFWKQARATFPVSMVLSQVPDVVARAQIVGVLTQGADTLGAYLHQLLSEKLWAVDGRALIPAGRMACVRDHVKLFARAAVIAAWDESSNPQTVFPALLECFLMQAMGCPGSGSAVAGGCYAPFDWRADAVCGADQGTDAGRAQQAKMDARFADLVNPAVVQMIAEFNAGAPAPAGDMSGAPYSGGNLAGTPKIRPGAVVPRDLRSGVPLRCVANADAKLFTLVDIQTYLKCNGLYGTGSLDGVLNAQTKKAIITFQSCTGLTPDGMVDDSTREMMRVFDTAEFTQCAWVFTAGSARTGSDGGDGSYRRSRRQSSGFSCPSNDDFVLNSMADYQRWYNCRGFLNNHPMHGRPDVQTIDATKALQGYVCMRVTGVVNGRLVGKMRGWFPGYLDPECDTSRVYNATADASAAAVTVGYECQERSSDHPLRTVLEQKIWFKCNDMGQNLDLAGEVATTATVQFVDTVRSFQTLKSVPMTGVVDDETKHAMWGHPGDQDVQASAGQLPTWWENPEQWILGALPTNIWNFRGHWRVEVRGGGSGSNPFYAADSKTIMATTWSEATNAIRHATALNEDGASFINPNDTVFEKIGGLESSLDSAMQASECGILSLGGVDASRVRAVAYAHGVSIEGPLAEVQAALDDERQNRQVQQCRELGAAIWSGSKRCCKVMPNCMGVSCHVPIDYIFASRTIHVWIRGYSVANETGVCDNGAGTQFAVELGFEIRGDDHEVQVGATHVLQSDPDGSLQLFEHPLNNIPLLGDTKLQLRVVSTETDSGDPTITVNLQLIKVTENNTDGKVVYTYSVFKHLPINFDAQCDADQLELPTVIDDMTLGQIDSQLIAHGLYSKTTDLAIIRARLRDVYLANFRGMLRGANVAGTEFPEPFDVCLPGSFALNTTRITFFDLSLDQLLPPGVPLCVGIICFNGGVSVHGAIGAYAQLEICLMSLRGTAWLQPWAGAQAAGYFSASLGPLTAGVRITARLLETSIPTFLTTVFKEWPLKICTGSDLEMIPLAAKLEVYLSLRVAALGFSWEKVLISATLWQWQMEAITMELWRNCEDEQDPSRPRFPTPGIAPANHWSYLPLGQLVAGSVPTKNCRIFDWESTCDEGPGKINWAGDNTPPVWQPETACYIGRRKCSEVNNAAEPPRENPNGAGWSLDDDDNGAGEDGPTPSTEPTPPPTLAFSESCTVEQVADRAADRPTMKLTLNTDYPEPESKVDNITYTVGTFLGGRDVVDNGRLWYTSTGGSELFTFELHSWAANASGIPLFFLVQETNAQGVTNTMQCMLPSFDTTPPMLTVADLYPLQSNPSMVVVDYTVVDDNEFDRLQYAFGRGPGSDSEISWTNIALQVFNKNGSQTGEATNHFTEPVLGTLLYHTGSAIEMTAGSAELCAQQCVHYLEGLGCHAFDYDQLTAVCNLHQVTQEGTDEVRLVPIGDHQYYERHSSDNLHTQIGRIVLEDLQLVNGGAYYFSIRVRNRLGYMAEIATSAMIIDLTPPTMGTINAPRLDVMLADMCSASEFQRCYQATHAPNHHFVIDGLRSEAVMFGVTPYSEDRYTRHNDYIPVHFNDWGDEESGLFKLVFGIGTHICSTDVYSLDDPHDHLYSEDDWVHQGLALPLNLTDGPYYVIVQGLNTPIYGGSLVTTVCHSTPLMVDRTPPIWTDVDRVLFFEDENRIEAAYEVADPHSHILAIAVGLGRSRHDTLLHPYVFFCVGGAREDGECRETFPEDDNARLHRMNHTLDEGTVLPDGVWIFVRLEAENNVGLTAVDPTGHAFLIDRTPPVAGQVNDGHYHLHDLYFQSSDLIICVNFEDFYDPESGISRYEWCVGSQPNGTCDAVAAREYNESVDVACATVTGESLLHNQTYYSTIWAWNRAHIPLFVMASSDGVRIDSTPPVAGTLVDGLNISHDIQYTWEGHVVEAIWDGFYDPESSVADYSFAIGTAGNAEMYTSFRSVGCGDGSGWFDHVAPVDCNVTGLERHDFNFGHGDQYRVHLRAMNGAHGFTDVSTNGVVVDHTPPDLQYIGDGARTGEDKAFFSSPTALAANVAFEDPESGIAQIRWRIYQVIGTSSRNQIYPRTQGEWQDATDASGALAASGLSLHSGVRYDVAALATNEAGASAQARTDGAMQDSEPPIVTRIAVGVLDEEEVEELVHGLYAQQGDTDGISAAWAATDGASGIRAYTITVTDVNQSNQVVTTVQLQSSDPGELHDRAHHYIPTTLVVGHHYRVCVVAVDDAELISAEVCSSSINIVDSDVTGVVFDGPIIGADQDFQSSVREVSFYWTGFSSAAHGITGYDYAVGAVPFGTEFQEYTSQGMIWRSDQCQVSVPLRDGATVFVTVRARTGANDYLETTSSGVVIDASLPVVSRVDVSSEAQSFEAPDGQLYIQSFSPLYTAWVAQDTVSAVSGSFLAVGTGPGLTDAMAWTPIAGPRADVPASALSSPGVPTILAIKAEDRSGLVSTALLSTGVVVDTTEPVAGTVQCPTIAIGMVSCLWYGFSDAESGIAGYTVTLTAESGTVLAILANITGTSSVVSAQGLQHAGGVYIITVQAVNYVGLTATSSLSVMLDVTPPVPGRVSVLRDSASVPSITPVEVTCITSQTQVFASWEPFQDPETGISHYEVGLGNSPGGDQYSSMRDVGNVTNAVLRGFGAMDSSVPAYVTVHGYNGVGRFMAAISQPLYVASHHHEAEVVDGNGFTDVDWQLSTSAISARWSFANPCEITGYWWAVYSVTGDVVQDFEPICLSASDEDGNSTCRMTGEITAASNDGLSLENGVEYYVVVRAIDTLNNTRTARSDGVRVDTQSVIPGTVFDGGQPWFVDVNAQQSVTHLSSSWLYFGIGLSDDGTRERPADHFEVEVGSDLGYSRGDVVTQAPVGSMANASFHGLSLTPRTVTYFSTVHAFSPAGASTMASSNGVVTGYGLAVLAGDIYVEPFQTNQAELAFLFEGFMTPMGTGSLVYEVAIGTRVRMGDIRPHEGGFDVLDYTCICIGTYRCPGFTGTCIEGAFSGTGARRVTRLGSPATDYVTIDGEISAIVDGLDLTSGRYFISVRASNDVQATNATRAQTTAQSRPIVVDVTPPTVGTLALTSTGTFDGHVAYQRGDSDLVFTWTGWEDPESGIETFMAAIVPQTGDVCEVPTIDEADYFEIGANASNYAHDASLMAPDTPYFVAFRAVNRVGQSSENSSIAFLIEPEAPVAGLIANGLTLDRSRGFASSTTSLTVTLLETVDENMLCRNDSADFAVAQYNQRHELPEQWSVLDGLEISELSYRGQSVLASPLGLNISLARDTAAARMLTGAVTRLITVYDGMTLNFDVECAAEPGAVFSAVLSDSSPSRACGDFKIRGRDINYGRSDMDQMLDDQEFSMGSPQYGTGSANGNTPGYNATSFVGEIRNSSAVITRENSTANADATAVASTGFQIHAKNTTEACSVVPRDACAGTCMLLANGACGPVFAVLLWSRYAEDTADPEHLWTDLNFDPTKGFHDYQIRYQAQVGVTVPEYVISLAIDGTEYAELIGVPPFHQHGELALVVHSWYSGDELPEVEDPLFPWEAVARMRRVTQSLEANPMSCEDGTAWNHFHSPVRYEAAVGTSMYGTDIQDYHPVEPISTVAKVWDESTESEIVTQFDRPCIDVCDTGECSSDAALHSDVQYVTIEVTGLHLELRHTVSNDVEVDRTVITSESLDNADEEQLDRLRNFSQHAHQYGDMTGNAGPNHTEATVYYVSLRAITPAGFSTTAVSSGFTMDSTPPMFGSPDCPDSDALSGLMDDSGGFSNDNDCGYQPEMIDPDYDVMAGTTVVEGMEVPNWLMVAAGEWQGSAEALGARWLATDPESEIAEYEWAIGTSSNFNSVLPWTSVGANTTAVRRGLSLQTGAMYCVTVRATNGGGLRTTSTPACIQIDATPPDLSSASIVPHNENGTMGTTATFYGTARLGAAYGGGIDAESGLMEYRIAIGTTPYSVITSQGGQDIFPFTALSQEVAATAVFAESLVAVSRGTNRGTAHYSQVVQSQLASDFTLTFQRGAVYYTTLRVVNHAHRSSELPSISEAWFAEQTDVQYLAASQAVALSGAYLSQVSDVRLELMQSCEQPIAVGLLAQSELEQVYLSANPEGNFLPYIHNPQDAAQGQVERLLRGRMSSATYAGASFFFSPMVNIPSTCSVGVTVDHSGRPDLDDEALVIVQWDRHLQTWRSIGLDNSDATSSCSATYRWSSTSQAQTTRACFGNAAASRLNESVQLSAFYLSGPFVDTPPVPSVAVLDTDENVAIVDITINATDAELDTLVFRLTSSTAAGEAALTEAGQFSFVPNGFFNGEVRLTYTVTEVFPANIGSSQAPLSATSTITVRVAPIPSAPLIMFVEHNTRLVAGHTSDAPLVDMAVQHSVAAFAGEEAEFTLLAFDPDGEQLDLVTNGDVAGAPALVDSARVALIEQYRTWQCEILEGRGIPCSPPWSNLHPEAAARMTSAVFTVRANGTVANAVETIRLLAIDSATGDRHSRIVQASIMSCARNAFVSMNSSLDSFCEPRTLCPENLIPSTAMIWHDATCITRNPTVSPTPVLTLEGGEIPDADAAADNGTTTSGSQIGLAIGLAFLFMAIVVVMAILLRRQKREVTNIGLALRETSAVLNPTYHKGGSVRVVSGNTEYRIPGVSTALSGSTVQVGDGEKSYAIPMANASHDQAVRSTGSKKPELEPTRDPVNPTYNPVYNVPAKTGTTYSVAAAAPPTPTMAANAAYGGVQYAAVPSESGDVYHVPMASGQTFAVPMARSTDAVTGTASTSGESYAVPVAGNHGSPNAPAGSTSAAVAYEVSDNDGFDNDGAFDIIPSAYDAAEESGDTSYNAPSALDELPAEYKEPKNRGDVDYAAAAQMTQTEYALASPNAPNVQADYALATRKNDKYIDLSGAAENEAAPAPPRPAKGSRYLVIGDAAAPYDLAATGATTGARGYDSGFAKETEL